MIIITAVFCTTAAGVAEYVIVSYADHPQGVNCSQLEPEGSVQSGTLSNPVGRQAELDAVVEEGILTFSINATPMMEDGKTKANLLIKSPSGNGDRFAVIISREDAGGVIYQSDYLDPEQYIEKARLDVGLSTGEYGCLASFDAHRIRDNVYTRGVTTRLTLYMQQ